MLTKSSEIFGRGEPTTRSLHSHRSGSGKRERTWWTENRVHIKIFGTEVDEAVRILALLPGAGTPYAHEDVPGLRRIYLRKVACLLYYTFDDREVIIRAVWGARRGRAPCIEP